ncbi:MAG: hypothetical protein Fur0010_15690 [Bdellovibrio sp.]
MKRTLTTIFCLSMMSSCAFMENRTFITEMEHETDGIFVPGRDFRMVPGDSGKAYRSSEDIMLRTPATEMKREQRDELKSMQSELARKEEKLQGYDRELYDSVSPYFESIEERLYYLSLSSTDREQWVDYRQMSINKPVKTYRPSSRSIASIDPIGMSSDRQIYQGMTKQDVVSMWGRPARVDVAGDPRNQNERWSYYVNGAMQYVFFENGVVAGWNLY